MGHIVFCGSLQFVLWLTGCTFVCVYDSRIFFGLPGCDFAFELLAISLAFGANPHKAILMTKLCDSVEKCVAAYLKASLILNTKLEKIL